MPVLNRPNILLILFDALGADPFDRFLSGEGAHALARLRDESVVFADAYTPCPESSPARASLFTGLDPAVHGLWTDGVALAAHERSFAERITHAGYHSGLVGRRHLAGAANWTTEPLRAGEYCHVDWAHGPLHRSRQNAYLAWLLDCAPDHYGRIFPLQADPDATDATPQQRAAMSALPDALSFNHWVAERIGEVIQNCPADRPFLAVAGVSVGASMGASPRKDRVGEDLDLQALGQADTAIAQMLDQLKHSGRDKDTVVVMTSACGTGGGGVNAICETAIKVPLMLRGPGLHPRRIAGAVSTLDIAPTFLQLAGLPHPDRMQGQCLFDPDLRPHSPRGWALSRLRRGQDGGTQNWQTALRHGRFKLVVAHTPPVPGTATYRLYDLETDPDAQTDLAANPNHAGDLEHMMDLMIDARCALEDRTEPRVAKF